MPHADILDSHIIVQTQWTEKELIKQIPGVRWDQDLKLWKLVVSWAACVQLRGIFGDTLTIGPKLMNWAKDERANRVDPATGLRSRLDAEDLAYDVDDALYAFQQAGVRFLHIAGCALLGDQMGTGKTIQVLQWLRDCESTDTQLPAVVICPNSVKVNWVREAAKWLPEANPYLIRGSAKARGDLFKQAALDPKALIVINIEAVRGHSRLAPYGSERLVRCVECGGTDVKVTPTRCEVHLRELNTLPLATVVVDEAHRIKDPHAKQTRACWAVGHGKSVRQRFALTGTPIANDPSDLWSLMHFVTPHEYPRRTAFIDRYCLQSWNAYGGLNVVGIHPQNREEFFKIFDPRFRRMTKAQVLPQLPPKVRSSYVVTLSPKQMKAYTNIETGLVTRLEDGSIMVAPNDLVAQTRLLQFSSAYMEETPEGFRMCEPSPKIDALMDILNDVGERQIVVTAEHKQLISLAAARLEKAHISYGLITGDVAQWDRDRSLQDFQSGKLKVLLFTLKAGGTGLTMTAADTIVFLQRSWSMIDNMQAEDRVHRIGSERHGSVHVIDVITEGTVEEAQVERLWEKAERLEEINRDRARLQGEGGPTTQLDVEENTIMNTNLGITTSDDPDPEPPVRTPVRRPY